MEIPHAMACSLHALHIVHLWLTLLVLATNVEWWSVEIQTYGMYMVEMALGIQVIGSQQAVRPESVTSVAKALAPSSCSAWICKSLIMEDWPASLHWVPREIP